MTFREFLAEFKTIEELMEYPEEFVKKLYYGTCVKNNQKCRIEFICANQDDYKGSKVPEHAVAAWITYAALEKDPMQNWMAFVRDMFKRRL